jgi:serine protease Do
MPNRSYRIIALIFVFLLTVSMACSLSGAKATETPTTAPTKEAAPTKEVVKEPTVTQGPVTPAGLVTTLDGVQSATIQIESEGTFVDPAVGLMVNAAGRGSGFIIDPSGLAITNNHVVTGGAIFKVWVGGDTGKTYNAKVVGASECSDLAVIQIVGGKNFPYLAWNVAAPKVGLDVYAAGFPLGDPQFTLTRGIISKEKTNGDTSWASVGSVLEHDAKIVPGNSGGPLVDAKGQVVGINYAGNQAGQYFAVGEAEAAYVIDELKAGKDVTSIGVNGEAVRSEDGTVAGIWVSSVKSGSPADKSGVKAGDIITAMENFALAQDGTMADYCNVLRSRNATDTIGITILRYATQEVLDGQLNGRALVVTYSFANTLGNQVTGNENNGGQAGYSDYVTVKDDSNSIQVDVPVEWSQVDGTAWDASWTTPDGVKHPFSAVSITASADVTLYNSSYDQPGVFFAASEDWGMIGGYFNLLEAVRSIYETDCTLDGDYVDYSDELYEGKYAFWKDCGPNKTWALVLAARPKDAPTAYLVLVEVKITTEADLAALDKVLATFQLAQ